MEDIVLIKQIALKKLLLAFYFFHLEKKNFAQNIYYFKSFTIDEENEYKYESANSIIINEGKEYFVSIGRLSSYTELFDFDNDKIISKKTKELIGYESKNMRPNLININKEENTFIFSCLSDVGNITYGIIMKFNLEFISNNLVLSENTQSTIEYGFGEICSCFITEANKLIICFYGYIRNLEEASFIILVYSINFNPLNRLSFTPSGINLYLYFYSIFFREDAGAFIYYKTESEISYPIIFFKEYNLNDNNLKDYFSNTNIIILDKYIFYPEYNLNELIKISDNKLAFIAGSITLETLYIVTLNIFKINYNCSDVNWSKYSSTIMMIGYPNKNDEEFDIINYLL